MDLAGPGQSEAVSEAAGELAVEQGLDAVIRDGDETEVGGGWRSTGGRRPDTSVAGDPLDPAEEAESLRCAGKNLQHAHQRRDAGADEDGSQSR